MKLLVPVLVGIIALGGLFIGLGYAGVVNIPGISPQKTEKQPAGNPGAKEEETHEEHVPAADPDPIEPHAALLPGLVEEPIQTPRKDGTERLAKLWSSLDSETLARILDKWPDGDAVLVLAKMDDAKLAELLEALPPERAAIISRNIRTMDKGGK